MGKQEIIKIIKETSQQNFARILNLNTDISFPTSSSNHEGTCIVLFDKWQIRALEEYFSGKKDEEEEPEQEPV